MELWRPKRLKHYPHFDRVLSMDRAIALANNPQRVASNKFFPFLIYEKSWQPYRTKPGVGKPKKKVRPIRYACRRDAYIFARYRELLAERYEEHLQKLGIAGAILAYRRIPVSPIKKSGKCNIHFAKDAFEQIVALGPCTAIALDISSFFESLDHQRIYKVWCELIGSDWLPPDHWSVFKAITRYRVVDKKAAYERLGFFGAKKSASGKFVRGYLVPRDQIPTQLCSAEEFRARICGEEAPYTDLAQKNEVEYGIPQGSPISDLIANFYLLDFDKEIAERVAKLGGVYYRYSDDILVLVPGPTSVAMTIRDEIESLMKAQGSKLEIKKSKTSIVRFEFENGRLASSLVEGKQGKNGLEYLGFRFDGRHAYLRDATVSAFYRKISRAAKIEARKAVARYPGKDISFLRRHFDLSAFMERFGRVRDFDRSLGMRNWTFWTYATRAAKIFGDMGRPILGQIANYRGKVRERVFDRIAQAVANALDHGN